MDKSETHPELADEINVKGMANIIEGCKKFQSKIIFVSTSFVYDGKKNEIRFSQAGISLAKKVLNYNPKTGFGDGIKNLMKSM